MVNSIANHGADVEFERQISRFATVYRLLRQAGLPMGESLQRVIDDPAFRSRLVAFWQGVNPSLTTDRMCAAREIMGKGNFFGPDDWISHFGQKVKFSTPIPEVPWSIPELLALQQSKPHFLFLSMPKLGETVLDIGGWKQSLRLYYQISGKGPGIYDYACIEGMPQSRISGDFGWYLMPTKFFGKYEPEGYAVPRSIERVTCNILYCLANGKYLDEGRWARVIGPMSSGYLRLTAFPTLGIHFQHCLGGTHDSEETMPEVLALVKKQSDR